MIAAAGCTNVADESGAGTSSPTSGEDESSGGVDTGTTSGTSGGTTGPASSGTDGTTTDASSTGSDTSESDTDGADDGLPVYEDSCSLDASTLLELNLPDGNAMAAPVQARMAVLDGWGVFGELSIRPWEFLNYYPFGYPAAAPGEVRIKAELFADPEVAGAYELQVGASAAAVAADDRPPVDLTLVVDVSGSMKGLPLTMLRESGAAIASSLRAGDTISIVTWDAEAAALLEHHPVSGADDPEILAVISALEATGGTDLVGGLTAGYALAKEAHEPGRIGRVVLMSDGGAAADASALSLIAAHAADGGSEGIYLIGVGVGSYGGYQPALMDSVTDAGRGAALFIGSADEAKRAFSERFLSLMLVGARDLRIQVTLPPGFRREASDAFLHDDQPVTQDGELVPVNRSLVYYERLSTCAPELATADAPVKIVVSYRSADTFELSKFAETTTIGELLAGDHPLLHKGAGVVGYAEALRLWNIDPLATEVFAPVAQSAWDRLLLASKLAPNDPSIVEIQTVLEVILKSAN